MSTEEKKLTSSEIDEMLKEMEEFHEPIRTKNNNRKKKSKIRADRIIAGIIVLALLVGAGLLILHFSEKSNKSKTESVKDNPLRDEQYPEISDVVRNYMNALLIEDSQERWRILAQYVDNMGGMTEKDISQINYVKSYSEIECYTKDGSYENTYVVFAYSQMELKNISTKVPDLKKLYVIRDAKTGNVYIHNGISGEVDEYIKGVEKDQDVQELKKEVAQEFEEALNSDERLKDFFAPMQPKTEAETSTPSETKAQSETTVPVTENGQPAATTPAAKSE